MRRREGCLRGGGEGEGKEVELWDGGWTIKKELSGEEGCEESQFSPKSIP